MVLITHTNIIVDDFNFLRKNPTQNYVYFLTHFHQDHWSGLNSSWNQGKIYCSDITKKLVTHRFPNIESIESLELNVPHTIYLNESKRLQVEVHFFEANHCPGSVMILFRGFMGTILYTGDFRFYQGMIDNNPVLFPAAQGNKDLAKKSIHVDEMLFDETFCDPLFKFPTKEHATRNIIEIIESNKGKRVFLCIDSIGKEDLMVELAKHFQTLIVVTEEKLKDISLMNFQTDLFTTDPQAGFIEVIPKSTRKERMKAQNAISITTSAWTTVRDYASPDRKNYIVLYSLHSDYKELETFIGCIQPCVLKRINKTRRTFEKYQKLQHFSMYLFSIKNFKFRGCEELANRYTKSGKLSPEFKSLTESRDVQDKFAIELGLKMPPEITFEERKKIEDAEKFTIFKQRNIQAFSQRIPGLDEKLSGDQVKFFRKKNHYSSGKTSYSQLFKNTLMFKEKNEKSKPPTLQHSPVPLKEHSTTPQKQPPSTTKSSNLSSSEKQSVHEKENLVVHEKENFDAIVVGNQEEYMWESSIFDLGVKQEEFDEERVIAVGDLHAENREPNAMLIEQSEGEKNFERVLLSQAAQHSETKERNQSMTETILNDLIQMENANLEQNRIEKEEKTQAAVLSIRRSVSFHDNDTLRDEDFDREDPKPGVNKESQKKVKVLRKPILKKAWIDDGESERTFIVCRSSSGSKKKVQFQGLKEDDEDGDGEKRKNDNGEKGENNDEQLSKAEPIKTLPKTQIGLISKVLQWRLKEEEEKRGIINVPAENNLSSATGVVGTIGTTGKVFQRTNTQEQRKPMFKMPGLKKSYKFKGSVSTSTVSRPDEANLKLLEDDPEEEKKIIIKPSGIEARKEENKEIKEHDPEVEANNTNEFSMSELWKSLNGQNNKKSGPSQPKKTSRLDFFDKVNQRDSETNQSDSRSGEFPRDANISPIKIKEKKLFDIVPDRLKSSNFGAQQQEPPKKDDFQNNDIRDESSFVHKSVLTGHFHKASQDNPSKKKVLIDKLLRAKETQSQASAKSPTQVKEQKVHDSPKQFQNSHLNDDNTNSLGQEIQEFLKKIRLKRQQEQIQAIQKAPVIENDYHQNDDFIQKEVDYQEEHSRNAQAHLSSRHTVNRTFDEEESFENTGSKLRIKNSGNVSITLNLDKNKNRVANSEGYETTVSKPQKTMAFQPTPDNDEDEYEEIIVVRRKIKTKSKKNSNISHNLLSNEHSSIEEILAKIAGRKTNKPLEPDLGATFADSPPSKARQIPLLQSVSNRVESLPVQYNPRNTHIQSYRQDIQEEINVYSDQEETNRDLKLNIFKPEFVEKPLENRPKRQSSTELAQKLLDQKRCKPTNESNDFSDIESNLLKNAAGKELKTLPQKVAKKKNLIEEDDPDYIGNFGESNFQSNSFRDDENSWSLMDQQQSNANKKKLEKQYSPEEAFYGVKLPPGSWRRNSKRLKTGPAGALQTQSQQLKKLKKDKLATQSTGEVEAEAQQAFGRVFGGFIDRNVLKK